MTAPTLLECRGVDVAYDKVQVLFGVDLDVTEGEIIALLGTNGAGKSTLLKAVSGLVRPTAGSITFGGRDITKADARQAGEAIGPVAGDEVFAQFAFPRGMNATFTSRARLRDVTGAWGIQLTGTKGALRLLTDVDPDVLVLRAGKWSPAGREDRWEPLDGSPGVKNNFAEANRRLIDDFLAAVRADREPTCGGENAAWAV
ncbi:MAG TPA: ATP-binding cassette domain-containing protein, partial [Acidimicrobiia bacterium]|nr:ATP-binding cassette domain-containing protein [Acidimicrobiia bacterium]